MEDLSKRQFTVGACLGRGGFGEVYRAKMASAGGLETDVAVKVLRNDLDPNRQALERLRDEGRLLARLNHPTILRVYDLVLLEGCASLVTEFVDGSDLSTCVVGPEILSLRAFLEVVAAVASALDAAWNAPGPDGRELRLVHRDIKPSNIRISRHGEVKLLDFGIARSDSSFAREARTQTDLMVGSPAYMAPERYLSTAVRPESDVFALGCCLFEGVSTERFFEDVSMPIMSVMAIDRSRYDKFLADRLRIVPASVHPGAMDLLRRMLSYDMELRPTAGPLVRQCEELSDLVGGLPLARWARARKWDAQPSPVNGPFEGRTITEGTMTRSSVLRSRREARAITPTTQVLPGGAPVGKIESKPPPMTATIDTSSSFQRPRVGGAGMVALGGAAMLFFMCAGGVAVWQLGLVQGTPNATAAQAPPPTESSPRAAGPEPRDEPVVGAPDVPGKAPGENIVENPKPKPAPKPKPQPKDGNPGSAEDHVERDPLPPPPAPAPVAAPAVDLTKVDLVANGAVELFLMANGKRTALPARSI